MDMDTYLHYRFPCPPHGVPLLLLFILEGELKPEFFLFLCSGQGLGHPSHALCVALRVWAVALKASGRQAGIWRVEGQVVVSWSLGQVSFFGLLWFYSSPPRPQNFLSPKNLS